MEKRLIIIDGNSIINRAFYALPDMSNSEGLKTNAIFGFVRMMFKIIEDYQPTHMSVAFDKKAPTFRHKQYADYKAGRKKMPDELGQQLEPLKELLDFDNDNRLLENMLNRDESFTKEEGKTLITTDEMIDKFYNAIFVDQYDGRKYNTTLGQYEFTKESKGFAISASSMLSRFAELS